MLEALVHWNGALPPNQHFIEITIPAGTSCEIATADIVPGWFHPNGEASRHFGRRWYGENRSAILIVPSVVARMEHNVLVNRCHPHSGRLTIGPETPVRWDQRLFAWAHDSLPPTWRPPALRSLAISHFPTGTAVGSGASGA